ncbi:hypothetical protein [uncultured Thalassospira sp.]|jgi:hypothetical protein|uniref:hypothetical protein n=1 Tax=uncultured Thalassospira sp. TaxID=404382 RepID=UPI0030DA4604|tara:strand:+ start:8594 stop:9055 length:462 start_codon:yes stop_codon:yes gene_type:complete
MTTDQMVIELKSVTFDLISLLERETEGMRTLDTSEYERFVSEKSALSMQYEQLVLELRVRAEDLKNLHEDEKAELRELQARFQDAAKRNMHALKAAEITNQRMVDTIVKAVKNRANEQVTTYNRGGYVNSPVGRGYSTNKNRGTLSISLNETF